MILGAVHRPPGICLTAEENPRKPKLGDCLMKGLCDQSLPQMGSFPPKIRSVGSHSTSGMEKEGNKEGVGWLGFTNRVWPIKLYIASLIHYQCDKLHSTDSISVIQT